MELLHIVVGVGCLFEHDFEKMAHGLAAIGMSWARYGLTVGKSALETSAKTLRHTADALGQLKDKLHAAHGCESTEPPPASGQPQDASSC